MLITFCILYFARKQKRKLVARSQNAIERGKGLIAIPRVERPVFGLNK